MSKGEQELVIAEFMEFSSIEGRYYDTEVLLPKVIHDRIGGNYLWKEELMFTSSWDWLMAVVGKIETLSYRVGRKFTLNKWEAGVQIKVDRMNVDLFSSWGTSGNTDVFNAILRAVLEFIKLDKWKKQ